VNIRIRKCTFGYFYIQISQLIVVDPGRMSRLLSSTENTSLSIGNARTPTAVVTLVPSKDTNVSNMCIRVRRLTKPTDYTL